jgi:hypothetical protein
MPSVTASVSLISSSDSGYLWLALLLLAVFHTGFLFKDGFAFSRGASEKKYAIKAACQMFHTCVYTWSVQSVDVGVGKATVLHGSLFFN